MSPNVWFLFNYSRHHLFGRTNETAVAVHWDSWWDWSPGSGYLWRDEKMETHTPPRHCLWPVGMTCCQSSEKQSTSAATAQELLPPNTCRRYIRELFQWLYCTLQSKLSGGALRWPGSWSSKEINPRLAGSGWCWVFTQKYLDQSYWGFWGWILRPNRRCPRDHCWHLSRWEHWGSHLYNTHGKEPLRLASEQVCYKGRDLKWKCHQWSRTQLSFHIGQRDA